MYTQINSFLVPHYFSIFKIKRTELEKAPIRLGMFQAQRISSEETLLSKVSDKLGTLTGSSVVEV